MGWLPRTAPSVIVGKTLLVSDALACIGDLAVGRACTLSPPPFACVGWYVAWRGYRLALLALCGDVHPNPGPLVRSEYGEVSMGTPTYPLCDLIPIPC